jgi:hypothetical protein
VKSREEWEAEVRQRQQNVDPIGRIPNVALFHGTLIRGSRRLNGVQRLGAFLVGGASLIAACLLLAWNIRSWMGWSGTWERISSLGPLLFGLLSVYLGIRVIVNAVLNDPPTRNESKHDNANQR